jgi:hypothetical protein
MRPTIPTSLLILILSKNVSGSLRRDKISVCNRPLGLPHEFEDAVLDNFVNGVLLVLLAWVVGVLLFDLYFWKDGRRRFASAVRDLSWKTKMKRVTAFRRSDGSGRGAEELAHKANSWKPNVTSSQ